MTKLTKILSAIDFMANPAKDIEVFGMFGAGNLGDEAMLFAARAELGARRTIACRPYAGPLLSAAVRRRKRTHLLVAGGTLIHGGKTGWLDYVEHRLEQGTRVSFFGTGMSFTDEQIHTRSDSFKRWGRILQNAEGVHLRGPRSVALSHEMGAKADVFGDFALMLYDPEIPLAHDASRLPVIGFNFGDCLGDQVAFEQASAQLLRHFHPTYQLVCHAVVKGDVPVTERIIAAAGLSPGTVRLERHYFDPTTFMRSIRDYRAFFGLKLHAAGLAMVAGVPSLMAVYRPKARDFMAPLEAEDLLVDLPMQPDSVIAQIERLLANPDRTAALTRKIAVIAEDQKARLKAAFAT